MLFDIDVRKSFPASGFTLDIQLRSHQQRLVLLGPSGAGKSLTLKAIAGLLTPDSGHIALANQCYFSSTHQINRSAQERQLGYMFQDYALFPHLTVWQNICFALERSLLNPPRRLLQQAWPWLEKFELQSCAELYPAQLSGGQKQRVALARALVTTPKALLLDEPFAAVDTKLRVQLRSELLQLQIEQQIPLIVITHDEADADQLGQQVIEIRQGKVYRSSN